MLTNPLSEDAPALFCFSCSFFCVISPTLCSFLEEMPTGKPAWKPVVSHKLRSSLHKATFLHLSPPQHLSRGDTKEPQRHWHSLTHHQLPPHLQEQLRLQLTPKPSGIRERNGKEGRDCFGVRQGSLPTSGSLSARRELQQQEKATFHPKNATGISPDQHRPPALPWWEFRAHSVTPRVLLKLLCHAHNWNYF